MHKYSCHFPGLQWNPDQFWKLFSNLHRMHLSNLASCFLQRCVSLPKEEGNFLLAKEDENTCNLSVSAKHINRIEDEKEEEL